MPQKYPEGAIIVCKKYSNETWKVVGACGEVRFFIRDECNENPIIQTVYNMEKIGWTVEETPWVPEEGDKCFCIEAIGEIGTFIWTNHPHTDQLLYRFGNCFHTQELAQAAAERVKRAFKNE